MESEKKVSRQLSHHILPTSANLLGICFLIFTMAHFQSKAEETFLDDCAALAILIFMLASLLSYLSIRSPNRAGLERVADISFIVGLGILTTTAVLIAFRLMK